VAAIISENNRGGGNVSSASGSVSIMAALK